MSSESAFEAIHESLGGLEEGLVTVADELARHAHDLKSALQPIHSNAEYAAVQIDRLWTAVKELRGAIGTLTDGFNVHRSESAEQHRTQMAMLRQIAGLPPEKRHPAAEP